MKIILSRKGFDSGYGGFPSPVLPNGEMLSVPIPVTHRDIRYSDILVKTNQTYRDLMKDLYGDFIKVEGEGKHPLIDLSCHLDPDLRDESYPRDQGWTGLFGQAGSSQSHLRNQGVGEGDIFLYFGWFRHTIMKDGKLTFDRTCKGFQAIYGYLQVGEMYQINQLKTSKWMHYHPHVKRGSLAKDNDCVYVASDLLSFDSQQKGWGTFNYGEKLKLTKDGYSRSRWELPDFMKELNISYHSEKSWKEDYFQSAMKGQEFVIEDDARVVEWVKALVR